MTDDWQSLISVEKVLDLHQQCLLRHNQTAIANSQSTEECVEGRIGNAFTAERYANSDDDAKQGLCFSGYLLYYLVRDHCFPDGNKRAAWASSLSVLADLGLTIKATDDEAYTLVDRIATGSVRSGIEVVRWIAERLESPPDPHWPF